LRDRLVHDYFGVDYELFLVPSFVVIGVVALLGYRYLRRACEPAA
jgi:hypothetical protein